MAGSSASTAADLAEAYHYAAARTAIIVHSSDLS